MATTNNDINIIIIITTTTIIIIIITIIIITIKLSTVEDCQSYSPQNTAADQGTDSLAKSFQ